MVTFLLARVHAARLSDLRAELALTESEVRGPVMAYCPRCTLQFFVDPMESDASVDVARVRDKAVQRLVHECPDHAHRFVMRE